MLAELPPELLLHIISFLTRLAEGYLGMWPEDLIPDLASINALSQTNNFFYRMLNGSLYALCASVEPLGAAALIFAVQNELEGTLDKCVAAGISLESESIRENYQARGRRVLSIAAATGSPAIVAKLLEIYGEGMSARVHAHSLPETALDIATRNGYMGVVRLLAPIPVPSSDVCPEISPSPSVQLETQRRYLGRALKEAIKMGHLKISEFLVSQGADISFCPGAVTNALSSRNLGLVQFLLASGADPNRGGFVPLFSAAKSARIEVVDALLAAGANPHATDEDSHNVLAIIRDSKLFRRFLELGVDPNHRDTSGNTPLHYTCFLPRDADGNACVELLLQFGAAVEAVNNIGQTPVDLAMLDNRPAIVEMLEPLVHNPGLKQRIAMWNEQQYTIIMRQLSKSATCS
ncbi:ankyrin repeat-containing domain protein [Mycena sanguinolenta]|nr:ankyrin repeat-containing domain protein [Mycena sanguinolenta]